jgi:hypothetical protein
MKWIEHCRFHPQSAIGDQGFHPSSLILVCGRVAAGAAALAFGAAPRGALLLPGAVGSAAASWQGRHGLMKEERVGWPQHEHV